ncbi:MAG: hypothetical protein FWE50_03775 [Alphaproteobacteria bacterium]|nr:hypothetical protein [Alphaproteobacteria bacterium]
MAEVLQHINTLEEFTVLFNEVIDPTGKWSSSAMQLDEDIAAAGYVYPKFFHPYNLPESKEELVKTSQRLWMNADANIHLKAMEKCLGKKVILSKKVKEELGNKEVETIEEVLSIVKYIKDNNPDLKKLKTANLTDCIHFIRGAAYGYPPENVGFFINNYKNSAVLEEGLEYKRILKEKFGIELGMMRLLKEQGRQLVDSLSKQTPVKRIFIEGKSNVQTDSFGRADPTGLLGHFERMGHNEY